MGQQERRVGERDQQASSSRDAGAVCLSRAPRARETITHATPSKQRRTGCCASCPSVGVRMGCWGGRGGDRAGVRGGSAAGKRETLREVAAAQRLLLLRRRAGPSRAPRRARARECKGQRVRRAVIGRQARSSRKPRAAGGSKRRPPGRPPLVPPPHRRARAPPARPRAVYPQTTSDQRRTSTRISSIVKRTILATCGGPRCQVCRRRVFFFGGGGSSLSVVEVRARLLESAGRG